VLNRRGFLSTLLTPALLSKASAAKAGPAPSPSALPPWPEENDPAFWDRVRDQFYIMPGEAFFNTGTLGATPRPVLERVIEDMRTLQATITRWDYTPNTPNRISGYSPELPLREKLGKLVNAEARDLALTRNATLGMNFVAQGIDRFMQYGTGNPSLLAGLDAALDFHFRLGPARVRQRICSLADRLRNGLRQIPRARIGSPVHPELAGAVVVHRLEGVPAAKLEEQRD